MAETWRLLTAYWLGCILQEGSDREMKMACIHGGDPNDLRYLGWSSKKGHMVKCTSRFDDFPKKTGIIFDGWDLRNGPTVSFDWIPAQKKCGSWNPIINPAVSGGRWKGVDGVEFQETSIIVVRHNGIVLWRLWRWTRTNLHDILKIWFITLVVKTNLTNNISLDPAKESGKYL